MDEQLKDLPEHLQPLQIVDEIASWGAARGIISLTEEAFSYWLTTDDYAEMDQKEKENVMYYYRMLMEHLRKVEEFGRHVYRKG